MLIRRIELRHWIGVSGSMKKGKNKSRSAQENMRRSIEKNWLLIVLVQSARQEWQKSRGNTILTLSSERETPNFVERGWLHQMANGRNWRRSDGIGTTIPEQSAGNTQNAAHLDLFP